MPYLEVERFHPKTLFQIALYVAEAVCWFGKVLPFHWQTSLKAEEVFKTIRYEYDKKTLHFQCRRCKVQVLPESKSLCHTLSNFLLGCVLLPDIHTCSSVKSSMTKIRNNITKGLYTCAVLVVS